MMEMSFGKYVGYVGLKSLHEQPNPQASCEDIDCPFVIF